MLSYRPGGAVRRRRRPRPEVVDWLPTGDLRMSANPHANGGRSPRDLELPDFRDLRRSRPVSIAEPTRVLGAWLRDVMTANSRTATSGSSARTRPSPTGSARSWRPPARRGRPASTTVDQHLDRHGRVMEILSETHLPGLAGGLSADRPARPVLLLRGVRPHRRLDGQPARQVAEDHPASSTGAEPIPSLNYLLTSHVWRQDHNGFSHQDPGFIDHVVNKKAEVVRVYLPPDANTLLSVADHCLRSRDYVNVIVAGKQPAPNWLDIDEAALHCARGLGIWDWASHRRRRPRRGPGLRRRRTDAGGTGRRRPAASAPARSAVRVVNVVDLMRLQPDTEHPHGLPDAEFDAIFTTDRPVIFAYHGYPWLIHRLTYRRTGHDNMHVRGYKEEGTTTTPFDMLVLNDMDRFHLVMDVIDRVPGLARRAAVVRQPMVDKRTQHRDYVRRTGEDLPEIRDWVWPRTS